MKKQKIAIYIATAVLVICVAAVLLLGSCKECCLCNAHTSSVPHLIDLQTGDMLSLTVDGPTSGPKGLTDVSTFSFIRFHTVTGTKQTSPHVIELKIPADDTVNTPALCNKCRKLLPQGYDGRYVIADMDSNSLLSIIAEGEFSFSGYRVKVIQEGKIITLIVK